MGSPKADEIKLVCMHLHLQVMSQISRVSDQLGSKAGLPQVVFPISLVIY